MFLYVFLIFLFFPIKSILPEDKREELLNKYMKKISLENIDNYNHEKDVSEILHEEDPNTFKYNISKIDKIIEAYNFPKNYDFFKENNIKPKVKDQGLCGSCWAFSSSSALSYRYKYLYDIDVDLSPQDAVSCITKTCLSGYPILDTQMSLVKNGLLTEECFPYTSGEISFVEECLDDLGICKNSSVEFKKYKSKNTYTTYEYLCEEKLYDVITIIIDQLITKGPVVSQISFYTDFKEDPEDPYYIYTHDESARYEGVVHAIVITGYGFNETQQKYYWITQNSWGEDWNINGFINIEFGQVGVEQVAFSEPYVPQEGTNFTDVNVQLLDFDEFCFLYANITNYTYKNMNNTLELFYKNINGNDTFFYHCNILPMEDKEKNVENKTIKCYIGFDLMDYNNKGQYKLLDYYSLQNENNFILDDKSRNKDLHFLGWPTYDSIFFHKTVYFISKRSNITFLMQNRSVATIEIYPYMKAEKPLRECHLDKLEYKEDKIIYCDLQEDELNYFQYNKIYEFYKKGFCQFWYTVNTYIFRFKEDKYPILSIEKIYQPSSHYISYKTQLKTKAKNEGYISPSVCSFSFWLYAYIEIKNINSSKLLSCNFMNYDNITEDVDIICYPDLYNYIKYDNLFILPYTLPSYRIADKNKINELFPFEILVKNIIIAEDEQEIEPIPEEEEEIEKQEEEKENKEEEGEGNNGKKEEDNTMIILIIIFSIVGAFFIILLLILFITYCKRKENDIQIGSEPFEIMK